MQLKKISIALAVIIAGTLPLSAMAAEKVNDYSLPQKVIDIANGSDDIIGLGTTIEHADNPDARFSSGGKDHTHQYIVANALTILNGDIGASVLNTKGEAMCSYTDWPDVLGNETDYGTFSGHFYDPDSGKNWMGQTSPTARTRAENYFQSAVAAYKDGYVDKAIEYIGKGTHYVSDLNQPHHAANLTAVNSNHSEFETYTDNHRTEYVIAGNSLNDSVYSNAQKISVGSMMYSAAKDAKSLSGMAQNKNTYDAAAKKSVQNAIRTVTQYIYKFGVETGIYR